MIFKVHCVKCDVDMHAKLMSDGKYVYTCPLCNYSVTIPPYKLGNMVPLPPMSGDLRDDVRKKIREEAQRKMLELDRLKNHYEYAAKKKFLEAYVTSSISNQHYAENEQRSSSTSRNAIWDAEGDNGEGDDAERTSPQPVFSTDLENRSSSSDPLNICVNMGEILVVLRRYFEIHEISIFLNPSPYYHLVPKSELGVVRPYRPNINPIFFTLSSTEFKDVPSYQEYSYWIKTAFDKGVEECLLRIKSAKTRRDVHLKSLGYSEGDSEDLEEEDHFNILFDRLSNLPENTLEHAIHGIRILIDYLKT